LGGIPLSATSTDVSSEFDFARLERVVAKLVEQQGDLQKVNAELRTRLAERDTQVRALEERLRTANQLRQDVAKRIDELIGQIDQLDAELEESES
jgi:chromosome segregation ATPase